MDDFCIYSSRLLHLEKVEEGLTRLHQLKGQLNIAKCHIGESQVALLGHIISQKGIEADPGKAQALVDMPSLASAKKQLISFLQKVRYLGRFIHLLSELVTPLQALAHANDFTWQDDHQECFDEVK